MAEGLPTLDGKRTAVGRAMAPAWRRGGAIQALDAWGCLSVRVQPTYHAILEKYSNLYPNYILNLMKKPLRTQAQSERMMFLDIHRFLSIHFYEFISERFHFSLSNNINTISLKCLKFNNFINNRNKSSFNENSPTPCYCSQSVDMLLCVPGSWQPRASNWISHAIRLPSLIANTNIKTPYLLCASFIGLLIIHVLIFNKEEAPVHLQGRRASLETPGLFRSHTLIGFSKNIRFTLITKIISKKITHIFYKNDMDTYNHKITKFYKTCQTARLQMLSKLPNLFPTDFTQVIPHSIQHSFLNYQTLCVSIC